jgi:hypothetical protein
LSQLPITVDQRHELIAQTLELIREGKSFDDASQQLGIARSTLNHWLLSTVPEKYREAQESGIIARITNAGEKLEDAKSHLDVARAREIAKFWQWIAERRLPAFAPKQEIGAPGEFKALDSLERARRVTFLRSLDVIDAEVVQRSTSEPDLTPAAGSDHKP